MNYKLKELKNSLRVVTVPLTNLESVAVTVWADVGSRYETKKKAGLSHFLEHMVFKGSKKRPSAKEIAHTLDSIGAEFNASTSYEYTNFYIKARKGALEQAVDILSDMVLNPILKEEDIKKEKGVIVEEISMIEDTPMRKINYDFINLVYGKHPLGQDIAGTKTSVKSIKKQDFIDYQDKHYKGRNLVITMAGAVDDKKAVELSEKYFETLTKGKRTKPKQYKGKQEKPAVAVENKKTEQGHLIFGYRAYPRNHKNRFALKVLTAVLGKGMSSRLFTEVRERRGLAYAVGSSTTSYQDTGLITTYAGVGTKNIHEAIKIIHEQHLGLASLAKNPNDEKYKIKDAELKKAKEYLKGRMALSLEDTTNVNELFGQEVLFGEEIKTPDEIFEEIDNVKLSDIYKVAEELFVPERLNLAVIGPYNKKDKFEDILE